MIPDPGWMLEYAHTFFKDSGFPAWVAAFLLLRVDKTLGKMTESLNRLTIKIGQHFPEE